MNNTKTIITTIILVMGICAASFAMDFAPFAACKTAGADLYVKKFKDTTPNKVNFQNTDAGCVVEIVSDKSASMLVRKVDLDSNKYRYVNFEFKVTGVIDGADMTTKKGDDAPARLYVFFEYEKDKSGFLEKMYRSYSGNERDGRAIVYVWGNGEKKGAAFANPYSDAFMQIIVESGAQKVGDFVFFKRNVYEDFKTCFKTDPPAKITSIAIMTDTDNTGSKAVGYFRNISLSSE